MRYFIVTLVLLVIPALCSAQIYKWVDEKGQTGYSDDLGKVPLKYRDKAVVDEGSEPAVEIIEGSEAEKDTKQGVATKETPQKAPLGQQKVKAKPTFEGKSGEAWKQDFARQKFQVTSLEEQRVGIQERMADGSKLSRGEYLTLQNTQRDLDVRIEKAKKKLAELTEAADNAGVPGEFR
jgi:hypothetical protein